MTMLMSSGIYRSPSYQDRCRVLALRRPASMTAPVRSGGARALKRRTVSGGEVIRTPSRIESMPNMRHILDATRRLTRRRERAKAELAAAEGTRTRCVAVSASRKTGAKTAAVRYSATKGADSGDDHATPPTTSGSSSVVVDIEATPMSSVVDRTSLPPPLLRPESLVRPEAADFTCLQSPVNSSGVRIVIDSDDDDDNDGVHPWSLTDLEDDAANQSHLPDESETAANSGSASSITSGSGDEESSNAVVLFQCGPSDDVDVVGVVESTSDFRSTVISGVAAPPTRDAKSNMGTGSDASSFHLLSDNLV